MTLSSLSKKIKSNTKKFYGRPVYMSRCLFKSTHRVKVASCFHVDLHLIAYTDNEFNRKSAKSLRRGRHEFPSNGGC